MKLSELRSCDNCQGPIAPQFWMLRVSVAMVMGRPTNQILGLTQMLDGSLALAEALAPESDPVIVLGDEDSQFTKELFICHECFLGELHVARLVEQRSVVEENGQ